MTGEVHGSSSAVSSAQRNVASPWFEEKVNVADVLSVCSSGCVWIVVSGGGVIVHE